MDKTALRVIHRKYRFRDTLQLKERYSKVTTSFGYYSNMFSYLKEALSLLKWAGRNSGMAE